MPDYESQIKAVPLPVQIVVVDRYERGCGLSEIAKYSGLHPRTAFAIVCVFHARVSRFPIQSSPLPMSARM